MTKQYVSTRGRQKAVSFYQAIVQGIGNDGGLLVPDFDLAKLDIKTLSKLSYVELATEILSTFVPKDGKGLLYQACNEAYGKELFPKEVVPIEKVGNIYIAELFHGQTAAFKDMALSLLPHLMTLSLKQMEEQKEVLILAATSGDTGKAALEGFENVPGTNIKVFYPVEGVSKIQQQQMVTQTGDNIDVIGINGNFDHAQTAVKQAFASEELKELCKQHNIFLSSANSINIGRLIPQIVYYFYSYFALVNRGEVEIGDKVNFCIPSGNFGNALAGYFGKEMGLPVNKFICASNKNNILTDFFTTGTYNTNRDFYKTNAPAMDILISSNLERLVYFMNGKDGNKVDQYMQELRDNGIYKVEDEVFEKIADQFQAGMLSEDEVLDTIKSCYLDTNYLLDTHTAIGYGVLKQYQESTKDQTKTILLATASPYKFPEAVYQGVFQDTLDVYTAIDQLHNKTAVEIPKPLQNIKNRKVLYENIIDKTEITTYIKNKIENM